MTNLPIRPQRINFDSIDRCQIERILKTGNLEVLSQSEREYYFLMELVRGWRAKMKMPGGDRIVTKAGIIKLLKQEPYGLSDWNARRVYSDAMNFFYSDDGIRPKAWANFYAEKLDKLADLAMADGRLKDARGFIVEAAKLRGCFEEQSAEIPKEILDREQIVIYTSDPESMGAVKEDRKQLERFIDSIPDIPEVSRKRVKEDAGILPANLLKRMAEDVKEFGDDEEVRD